MSDEIRMYISMDKGHGEDKACCTFGYIEGGLVNVLGIYYGDKAEKFHRALKREIEDAYMCGAEAGTRKAVKTLAAQGYLTCKENLSNSTPLENVSKNQRSVDGFFNCGCGHPDRHRSPIRSELLGGGIGYYCRYCNARTDTIASDGDALWAFERMMDFIENCVTKHSGSWHINDFGSKQEIATIRARLTEAKSLTEAIGEKERELIKLRALVEKQTLQIAKRNGEAKANEAAVRDLAAELQGIVGFYFPVGRHEDDLSLAKQVLKTHAKAIEDAKDD